MRKLDVMGDQQYVFGAVLIAANRIDALLERELNRFDMTTKQWFLCIILDNLFDTPPTIKEVAKEMGSSHQNVKQVALKLAQKGLLTMVKDPNDARTTRLQLTEQSYNLREMISRNGIAFNQEVFKDIQKEELCAVRVVLTKMLNNLAEIEDRRDLKKAGGGSRENLGDKRKS